jgi:flagellar hook-associated protein 2
MSVTIGGTFSGLNVSSIISSIIAADSIPITNLQTDDTTLQTNSTTLGALGTSLGQLSTVLQSLTPDVLASQTATGSDATVGTATVDSTAQSGSVSLDVTQLASSTVLRSGSGSNSKLTGAPAGDTPIGTVLDESSVDGETFTINGKQITLASTDVLDDGNPDSTSSVIGKINNSGAGVMASYDSSTGDISLTSSSPIILGASTDTSDFLQQAQLFNNGTDSVTSSIGIGRIDPDADLATAGLATAPTAGTFTINGVSINYHAGDSLNTVIGNINASGAGVTAIYDTYEDQLVLTSTTRGPQNITVADGTSNAATALRLTSSDSQIQQGNSTIFTVNGSSTVRQSDSNVISASDLGVQGLTFTATGTGSTQVTIAPDVTNIAAAINAFVTQYNTTQTLINTDTAVDTSAAADTTDTSDSDTDSTDTSDSTTSNNGPLATDDNLTFLAPELRAATSDSVSNTATIRMLSDLGVDTNANDNTLTEVDTTKLQAALTNNLSEVETLFTDPTVGLTTTVQNVISSYNDSLNGAIVNEQNDIAQQVTFNQGQITEMQEQITVEQTNLENEFAALDSIEGDNQDLSSVLSGSTGTSTSTSDSSSSSSSSSPSSFGSVGSSS